MPNQQPVCHKKTSIGGQALIEGVMMRGPQVTAMAVRHVSGEIVEEQWPTTGQNKAAVWKMPIFRGMYNMVDSMRFGYKCLMRSAELAGLEDEDSESCEQKALGEDETNEGQQIKPTPTPEQKARKEKKDKLLMSFLMVVSSVLGVALAIGLFLYLPSFLYNWLAGIIDAQTGSQWANNAAVRGIFEGILRLVLFIGYLMAVSLMKDMRRVFMYHGAEHKTIFCYEAGEELTVENVRKQRRFHPRCGTSFLILMLLIGIIVSMCIPIKTVWLRVIIKLAILPLVVGIGYELIKLAGRKTNWLTKAISAPGLWMQRITTKEPDDSMIECAIAALKPVIPDDPELDKW